VEGFSIPGNRSDRVVLEANTDYWDPRRFPRLQRIVFDNTLEHKAAVELVKAGEGRIDLVTKLRPLDTLRVAQSPAGTVVKNREALVTVAGLFNMRKTGSPWTDVRVRQAANFAINRADLIRYAAKGNGTLIPALVPRHGFGYDSTLAPYPFDPATARRLLWEAGYPEGLTIRVIAPEALQVQATVVSKMLERVGTVRLLNVAMKLSEPLIVAYGDVYSGINATAIYRAALGFASTLQILDVSAYNRQTFLGQLEGSPEQQSWDIAIGSWWDILNFPVFQIYHFLVFNGPYDWILEQPALRQLREQVLRTVDRGQQEALIRQMERHTYAQAYGLFLYNPIQLFAVNKAVKFVPYVGGVLNLAETAVTDDHWSVRKAQAVQKSPPESP
jgi:ABC-type transport system substrate-binding protein